MEKLKSLLTSKKFWTLVAAIVAALTAFFTTSCAAQAKIQREGIHIDTVRVDYIIRSKNFQTLASCSTIDRSGPILRHSIPKSGPFSVASDSSIGSALTMNSPVIPFSGFLVPTLIPRSQFLCSPLSSLSSSTRSIIASVSNVNYSFRPMTPVLFSAFPLTSRTFGERCLIAFVPIAFLKRSRRGGRRGKGRPKGTKSIPIGGSHF